jgi:hypothetical protein
MRSRILLAAAMAAAAATGCESSGKSDTAASPPSADPAAPTAGDPAAPPPKSGSNIERIPIAVPYGKRVDCASVVDMALFSKYIGGEIGEVKDRGASNSEASMSCAFIRAGKPPASDAQLRKYQREGQKLGVLPGDEYCMVTAYCSMATDEERFKKKCDADKDSLSESVGQAACVHTSQRGTKYAYTYRVIDPDTRCTLEVMGGPSVTDEPLVQNCTRAALEDISLAELKNYH